MVENVGNSSTKTLLEYSAMKHILWAKSILLFVWKVIEVKAHILDSIAAILPVICFCVTVRGRSEDILFLCLLAVPIGKKAKRKMRQQLNFTVFLT